MTLVLPFGGDQISSSNLFMRSGSNQSSSMPCVFENDSFEGDFESALMRDWASEIDDYEMSSEDSSIKAPSDANELKRKSPVDNDEVPEAALPKKPRFHNNTVPVVPSGLVSSSPSFIDPSSSMDTPSSSSSSSSSSEGDNSAEDDYMPVRRRGIQMWNSRQRWKDERKKVMKMSVTKLSEIDDPELCLLRSVLINNTIKKLHNDIKNDRQAKIRYKQQQRMDWFNRFPPLHTDHMDFEDHKPATSTPDFYDDNSCDEMFGISEDFLRVTIPDRRVSSPVPPPTIDVPTTSSPSVTVTPCYSSNLPSCDSAVDCCRSSSASSQTVSTTFVSAATNTTTFSSSSPIRRPAPVVGQCATQYRTSMGDVSFPPRVPILDSVVYHSLLASLESS